jgi:hypothetical protein
MDMLDLSQVQIHASPADVFSWPTSALITGLEMSPSGGLTFTFDRKLPDRWKWLTGNKASPDDNFQYTVWAVVKLTGGWHAAGFVQMWQGRPMGDGALPPILTQFVNWWGDVRHLWGEMSDYLPRAGDQVGFFVTAGNARLRTDVTSVRERSNVVVVTLPAGDAGSFTFGSEQQPPVPPWPPVPPPNPPPPASPDETAALKALVLSLTEQQVKLTSTVMSLLAQVDALAQQVAALRQLPAQGPIVFPNYQTALFGATVVLKPQPK